MEAIQLESQVGDDRVLSLHVPFGVGESRSRVIVSLIVEDWKTAN